MGVLNIARYFDPMIALLDHAVAQQFVRPEHRRLLKVSADPESLVIDVMSQVGSGSPRQRIDVGNG